MGTQGSQQYATFLVEKAEQIATVRFNRPEKLNPINLQVVIDLETVVHELEDDYETRVVVLTGQGRSFSVGADFATLREPRFPGRSRPAD